MNWIWEGIQWLSDTLGRNWFVANVTSGFFVLIFDVALIGGLIFYLQHRQWNKTRQSLAYILTATLARVIANFDRCLQVDKDGRVLLNSAIRTSLPKMKLVLGNFDEQMIVHLPAFLPSLSENLSELTRHISGLEDQVLEAGLHLERMWPSMPAYEPDSPEIGLVDPLQFYPDHPDGRQDIQRLHLKRGMDHTPGNYFVLGIVEIIGRLRAVEMGVAAFADAHSREWVGFPSAQAKKAGKNLEQAREWNQRAASMANSIVNNGLHLVHAPRAKVRISTMDDVLAS